MDGYVFFVVSFILLNTVHVSLVGGDNKPRCGQDGVKAICTCSGGGETRVCFSTNASRKFNPCNPWCEQKTTRCFQQVRAKCMCESCRTGRTCAPERLPKFCHLPDLPSTTGAPDRHPVPEIPGSTTTPGSSTDVNSLTTESGSSTENSTEEIQLHSSNEPATTNSITMPMTSPTGRVIPTTQSMREESGVITREERPPKVPTTMYPTTDSATAPTQTGKSTTTAAETSREAPAQPTMSIENSIEVAGVLLDDTSGPETIGSTQLEDIMDTLSRLEEIGSGDENLTSAFIGVVNNVMDIETTTMLEVPGVVNVVQLLEDQLSHLQKRPGNYSERRENLAVEAVKLDRSSMDHPVRFEDPFDEAVNESRLAPRSSIELPAVILDSVLEAHPNIEEIPITFIVFREPDLFLTPEDEGEISSRVISAKVDLENITISNLATPVVVTFVGQESEETTDPNRTEECVFWDYSAESMRGRWSTVGCDTVIGPESKEITCLCNHLTSFAVLVKGHTDSHAIGQSLHHALSILSTVGCYLSICGLSICLLLMVFVRSVRVKQETRVHINLCISLLGLYLTFVVGIERTGNPLVCRILSAIIHFFCLASVAWMSAEAFIIYKLIYKFQHSNIRHLLKWSVLFAWGIPCWIAIAVYFLDDSHDYTAQPDFCFLHEGYGFFLGFLLPALLLTLYNSTVFLLATYRLYCRSINAVDDRSKRSEVLQRIYSTVLFWILLGLSWVFGFLSSFQNSSSIAFQFMFCALLSLQGLFLFYFLFVQNPILRSKVTELVSSTRASNKRQSQIPLAANATSSNFSRVDSI